MISKLRSPTLTLGLLTALVSLGQGSILKRQEECELLYVGTNEILYPVALDTYIGANTVLNIGGITINIDNAPTYINTVVTATTTVNVTQTVTAGAAASTTAGAIPAGAGFVVQIAVPAAKVKRSTTYLTFDSNGLGHITTVQAEAAVFSLSNGQLVSGKGAVGPDAAQLSTGYGNFELFTPPSGASITTTWSAAYNKPVVFSNSAFTITSGSNDASFCQAPNGYIFIIYTTSPPASTGCSLISFVAAAAPAVPSSAAPSTPAAGTSSGATPSTPPVVSSSAAAPSSPAAASSSAAPVVSSSAAAPSSPAAASSSAAAPSSPAAASSSAVAASSSAAAASSAPSASSSAPAGSSSAPAPSNSASSSIASSTLGGSSASSSAGSTAGTTTAASSTSAPSGSSSTTA